jgi:hypothetical protein
LCKAIWIVVTKGSPEESYFIEDMSLLCYNLFTMEKPNLTGLVPAVANKIGPMLDDLLKEHASNIHSIHVTGSAVISDYHEKFSDINSVVVLRDMDLKFITFLAPLGKKYGKKKIAAPLVMTPEYIGTSLDAFPVEFLDFKLIHKTVYGPDIFATLEIAKAPLRLQVEREIKTKLIHVRQGYISSLGKKENLSSVLVRSFTGSMALFRAIIKLLGKEPPVARTEVITAVGSACGIDIAVFTDLLLLKADRIRPGGQELYSLFERYYNALEATGKIIDELAS